MLVSKRSLLSNVLCWPTSLELREITIPFHRVKPGKDTKEFEGRQIQITIDEKLNYHRTVTCIINSFRSTKSHLRDIKSGDITYLTFPVSSQQGEVSRRG